jgi:hypothetical protein
VVCGYSSLIYNRSQNNINIVLVSWPCHSSGSSSLVSQRGGAGTLRICDGQSGTGTSLYPSPLHFRCRYHSTGAPYSDSPKKRGIKGILLHNGNKHTTVSVAHSVHLKKMHENLEILLNKIKCNDRGWLICGDLRVNCMLLGQQPGYTKFPCCYVNGTRSQHWKQTQFRSRLSLMLGAKNTARENLVHTQEFLLPSFRMKIGLKQSVKTPQREENVSNIFTVNVLVFKKKNLKQELLWNLIQQRRFRMKYLKQHCRILEEKHVLPLMM